jgi:hypothetical protein
MPKDHRLKAEPGRYQVTGGDAALRKRPGPKPKQVAPVDDDLAAFLAWDLDAKAAQLPAERIGLPDGGSMPYPHTEPGFSDGMAALRELQEALRPAAAAAREGVLWMDIRSRFLPGLLHVGTRYGLAWVMRVPARERLRPTTASMEATGISEGVTRGLFQAFALLAWEWLYPESMYPEWVTVLRCVTCGKRLEDDERRSDVRTCSKRCRSALARRIARGEGDNPGQVVVSNDSGW